MNAAINNEAVPYKGTVTAMTDTGITVQISGRLGILTIPWRMVLSNNKVEVGQTVYFSLSLLEVMN
ncbi:MAG: hypothetical protein LBV80_05215 [Deltaproteobacteria bacterium]|jgi:ribosomal protein S1|nr:hypothetical protein [Deltaproteobacteria bacterium]